MDTRPQCQRCGSGNLKKVSQGAFWLTYMIGAGFILWIGLMLSAYWITTTILFLFTVIMFLARDTNQCQDCKYTWLFEKKEPDSRK